MILRLHPSRAVGFFLRKVAIAINRRLRRAGLSSEDKYP
jgi:hypothetical protein